MNVLWTVWRYVLHPYRWWVLLFVLINVVAQVVLIASLVLPWQLLQILATGHSRLDGLLFATGGGINQQVLTLVIIVAACFCTYLLLNRLNRRVITALAERVIHQLNKTKIIANHRVIGQQAMAVILRCVASALIVVLFTLVMTCFYPVLALLAWLFILGTGMVVRLFYRFDHIQSLQNNLQGNVLTVVNIGFALSFAVIIYDFSHQQLQSLPVIFFVVLLMRQILIAGLNVWIYLLGMHKRYRQINMLFLPRQQQIELPTSTTFEEQFARVHIGQWLPNWFAEHGYVAAQHISIAQCKLLNQGTSAQVLITNSANTQTTYFLLKCYSKSRENEARHEMTLFDGMADTAILPKLLHSGEMSWCFYLLLQLDSAPQWMNSDERKPLLNHLRRRLYNVSVPSALQAKYQATFFSLPERMQRLDWSRFDYLTIEDRTIYQVDTLMTLWPRMIECITALPHCLMLSNPGMARMICVEEELLVLDWHGWIYDTIGVHWQLTPKIRSEVAEVIGQLWQNTTFRAKLTADTTLEQIIDSVVLAARTQEFYQRYTNKNDLGTLNMIQSMLRTFALIEKHSRSISS